MPRDVSGNYTLPAGNPVVTGTLIASSWANTTLNDVATAMTNSLDRTGTSAGMTGQFKAAAGVVGSPGISWQLEPTSGWYRNAAGDFRFSIGGTDVLKLVATGISFLVPFLFPDGTVTNPALTFASDGNTGFYRIASDEVGLSLGGVKLADWGQTQVGYFGSVIAGVATILVNNTSTVATQDSKIQLAAGTTSLFVYSANQNRATAVITGGPTTAQAAIYTGGAIPLVFGVNSITTCVIDANGHWTWSAPQATGQTGYTFNGLNGNNVMLIQQGAGAGTAFGVDLRAGTNSSDYALAVRNQPGSLDYLRVRGDGFTFVTDNAASPTLWQVGYMQLPLNSPNVAYSTVLSDQGMLLRHTSGAAHTYTINDATVNYPNGTVISFVCIAGASALTIALQTTATNLVWLPTGATGNRTLTAPGLATATKVSGGAPGVWYISGTNLS
jgi:hypothetical protein